MIIKSELVNRMGKKLPALSERDIALSVTHIVDKICHTLTLKQRVEIRGFGVFSLRFRASRSAHNPKTGQKITTPAKYAVRFKPGNEMRTNVNAKQNERILRGDRNPEE